MPLALHCSRAGRLVRLSLTIEIAPHQQFGDATLNSSESRMVSPNYRLGSPREGRREETTKPACRTAWQRGRAQAAACRRRDPRDPACSDRSIAHDLGVNWGLVARMRRELAVAGEAVLGLPVRGRDGRPTSTRPGTCRGSRNWTGSTADCTPWSGWSNRRSSRGPIGAGRRRSAGCCVGSSSGCGSGSTDWIGSKRRSIPGVNIVPK